MTKELSAIVGQIAGTPLGNVWVALSEHGLIAVEFQSDREKFSQYIQKLAVPARAYISFDIERTKPVLDQIVEFLNGERVEFEIPIDWSLMSHFQGRVLRLTSRIPYGETRTYSEIAAKTGYPKAARAVGRAQATNPMPLVIPCHRVLGTDGSLRGYGAANGIETKAWLLELESSRRIVTR